MKTMEIFVNISSEMHICKNQHLFSLDNCSWFYIASLAPFGYRFFWANSVVMDLNQMSGGVEDMQACS
jgi:hypothetical protein